MKVKMNEDRAVISEMINGCSDVVDRPTAVRGIRAVCKYFGGQLIYIPVNKTTGDTTGELSGILRDAVGDAAAKKMLDKLMALMGGWQIYVPMEKGAFRGLIAREIHEKYDGDKTKIRALCREYGMSFTQVYRLWLEGRDKKNQMNFEFEEKHDNKGAEK